MTSTNLLDLFGESKDEDISDLGTKSDGYKPPAGEWIVVQPVMVRPGETKAGLPSWGVMLKVVGGEDNGKSFFANFYLNADYPSLNAAVFHYLALFGLDIDTLNGGLVNDQLDAIVSANPAVNLRPGYRKAKTGDMMFDDHHFTAVEDSVVVADDDEDDSNFRY